MQPKLASPEIEVQYGVDAKKIPFQLFKLVIQFKIKLIFELLQIPRYSQRTSSRAS